MSPLGSAPRSRSHRPRARPRVLKETQQELGGGGRFRGDATSPARLPAAGRQRRRAGKVGAAAAQPAPARPGLRLRGLAAAPPDLPGWAGSRSENSRQHTTACRSSPPSSSSSPRFSSSSFLKPLHFVEEQTSASRPGPERRGCYFRLVFTSFPSAQDGGGARSAPGAGGPTARLCRIIAAKTALKISCPLLGNGDSSK